MTDLGNRDLEVIASARERARIRREIRKSDDRIADQLDALCDEVERLRAEVASLTESRNNVVRESGAVIIKLRAENSHLHHQTNKLGEDVLRLRAEVAHLEDIIRREAWLENAIKTGKEEPYVPHDEYCRQLRRAEAAEAERDRLREQVSAYRDDIEREFSAHQVTEANLESALFIFQDVRAERDRLRELLRDIRVHGEEAEGVSERLDAAIAKEKP